ncbi:NUDIX domain-containing protein [Micromonospora humida]|uniref:NUDIX domain-containing protein n=1 Tax=Micromonospora humida TaxID=2809018 RepID=UPI0034434F17
MPEKVRLSATSCGPALVRLPAHRLQLRGDGHPGAGGGVRPGEDPADAALREARERLARHCSAGRRPASASCLSKRLKLTKGTADARSCRQPTPPAVGCCPWRGVGWRRAMLVTPLWRRAPIAALREAAMTSGPVPVRIWLWASS